MNEKLSGYREMKAKPEAKDYRDAMARALIIAKNYDRSEKSYNELMESLEHLEEVIQTTPGLEGKDTQTQETEAALKFAPISPKDINDVLDIASQSADKAIKKSLEAEDGDGPIRVRRVEGIILKPAKNGPIIEAGSGNYEPPETAPKFSTLLQVLAEEGIYSDDIIVSKGDVDPKQVRKESYYVVEIPRADKTILVCDLIGEATFVIRQLAPCKEFIDFDKDELEDKFGKDQVIRIEWRDNWSANIKKALQDTDLDKINKKRIKVDLQEFEKERIIESIRAQYTPDSWLELKGLGRNGKRIDGITIYMLGKMLLPDIQINDKFGTKDFIMLGIEIFGPDKKLTKELESFNTEPEFWKAEVLKKYPTSKEWVAVTTEKRREMHFGAKKLIHIAGIFKMDRKVLGNNEAYYMLGQEIYGQDDPLLLQMLAEEKTRQEAKDRSTDEWTKLIKEALPTATDWIDFIRKNAPQGTLIPNDVIKGIGIVGLLSKFKILRTTPKQSAIMLGFKIYGDNDTILIKELERLKTNLETKRKNAPPKTSS